MNLFSFRSDFDSVRHLFFFHVIYIDDAIRGENGVEHPVKE